MRPFALPALLLALTTIPALASSDPLGLFTDHTDVGNVLHPGATKFNAKAGTYTITGSGENMWFARDDFQFVWKQVADDVSISADIHFEGTSGNRHRKAVLMIRQSLAPDSPAVDIALHGDGLTSLQFRDATGGNTHEVESAVSAPTRVRLEKRGNRLFAFVSGSDGKLHPAGASILVPFTGPFYIGLGVSSHDPARSETAVFSNVTIDKLDPLSADPVLWSTLEIINIVSTDRRVAYLAPTHFEAPNWSRDGTFLLVNRSEGSSARSEANTGRIVHLDWNPSTLAATNPTVLASGDQVHINNDHGLSPDGKTLAISDNSSTPGSPQNSDSRVYLLPVTGGTPRQITPTGPSYWHGWSPDGHTLAFVGQRQGEFDIYTVPTTGGSQTRLTTAPGLDDGPEYTPDGKTILFCSVRSGHMQLWQMNADGSGQQQLLTSDTDDWFPHISPDGKLVAFIAFPAHTEGHPPNKNVELRILDLATHQTRTIARLFGGQGTMNVPSWAPDSQRLAFVSYELLSPAETPAP